MPYIKKNERPFMDVVVDSMKEMNVEPNGKLNYVLYKFCLDTVKPSYNNYKNYCAELEECANEIRRRLLSKYEDFKISKNGDVE